MPDASAPARSLRATYRLQFHRDFRFSQGGALAGYLQQLGISHVYSSPILTARAGSLHGYDVVAYDAINPELGGEPGFRDMAATLRHHGIGIILDIVPNHVAVGGSDNRMWLDLLKNGQESRYARWFDIDFDCPDPEIAGKVHAPFLGEPLSAALAAGKLTLSARQDADGFAIIYGDHMFPVRTEDDAGIVERAVDAFANPALLAELLARQNFVLDWWRNAGDRINWRRFFDITQLAAMRMEEPDAFEAKHAVPLRLYREGLIDGLRIDHVDGLGDPAAYCRQLRRRLGALEADRPPGAPHGRAWLVVEKILASGELIPADWEVDGSTGYDFMDQVSALQHEAGAHRELADHWAAISGRVRDFHGEEEMARHQILSHSFDGQREGLVDALERAGADHRDGEGLTRGALRRAVTSLLVQLRAYRSYVTGDDQDSAIDERLQAALRAALGEPLADRPALEFVGSVLAGRAQDAAREHRISAIRRFNQLSAPLAAKAVEDTAFYRYGRLLSRNDVGFDASALGMSVEAFHGLMHERASGQPQSMLATATHDHKRGEDVRARLAVLSEIPAQWIEATRRWTEANAAIRPAGLDPGDEHMLYQTLIGAWPLGLSAEDADGLAVFRDRVGAWWIKALREAKLRSSWAAPNAGYEQNAQDFLAALLSRATSEAFLRDAEAFAGRIAAGGAANGLVQLTLKCTAPGVPDIYQGTEFWDLSLVDPDNRRAVDFDARKQALALDLPLETLAEGWRDGRIKQAVLGRLLNLRRQDPELFAAGSYEAVAAVGPRRPHVIAFMRTYQNRAVLIVASHRNGLLASDDGHLVRCSEWWGDTSISLPVAAHRLEAVIGPDLVDGQKLALGQVLSTLPLAVWRAR